MSAGIETTGAAEARGAEATTDTANDDAKAYASRFGALANAADDEYSTGEHRAVSAAWQELADQRDQPRDEVAETVTRAKLQALENNGVEWIDPLNGVYRHVDANGVEQVSVSPERAAQEQRVRNYFLRAESRKKMAKQDAENEVWQADAASLRNLRQDALIGLNDDDFRLFEVAIENGWDMKQAQGMVSSYVSRNQLRESQGKNPVRDEGMRPLDKNSWRSPTQGMRTMAQIDSPRFRQPKSDPAPYGADRAIANNRGTAPPMHRLLSGKALLPTVTRGQQNKITG